MTSRRDSARVWIQEPAGISKGAGYLPELQGGIIAPCPTKFSGDANSRERNVTSVQDNAQRVGAKDLPGQVVLVLQGGGALGSYQAGVYQALHEAGIEPDWIIGTSIGAINASLIAGNAPDQ